MKDRNGFEWTKQWGSFSGALFLIHPMLLPTGQTQALVEFASEHEAVVTKQV